MSNEPPFDDDDLINDFYEEPDEYPDDEFDISEEYMQQELGVQNDNHQQQVNQQPPGDDSPLLNQGNEIMLETNKEKDVPSHVSFDTNEVQMLKSDKPELYSFER